LEFGLVGVNDWVPHATEGPFTGWKESGMGRESGAEGLDEYLETSRFRSESKPGFSSKKTVKASLYF